MEIGGERDRSKKRETQRDRHTERLCKRISVLWGGGSGSGKNPFVGKTHSKHPAKVPGRPLALVSGNVLYRS